MQATHGKNRMMCTHYLYIADEVLINWILSRLYYLHYCKHCLIPYSFHFKLVRAPLVGLILCATQRGDAEDNTKAIFAASIQKMSDIPRLVGRLLISFVMHTAATDGDAKGTHDLHKDNSQMFCLLDW